jgi:hypothetical protein
MVTAMTPPHEEMSSVSSESSNQESCLNSSMMVFMRFSVTAVIGVTVEHFAFEVPTNSYFPQMLT